MSARTGYWLAGMAAASAAALTLTAAAFGPGTAGRTARDPHLIRIESFVYDPSALAIRTGDIVTWTNLDIVPHTVTAVDGSWDSGEIGPGESWSLNATETILRDYFCAYHPGMRARLDREHDG